MSTSRGQLPPGKKNAHLLRDWGSCLRRGKRRCLWGEHGNWPKYVKGCKRHEGRSHPDAYRRRKTKAAPTRCTSVGSCAARHDHGQARWIPPVGRRRSTLRDRPSGRALGKGKAFCTAAETCPPDKSCGKKPNAGRDRLKACVKGLHAFQLAPKLPFAHPKLSPSCRGSTTLGYQFVKKLILGLYLVLAELLKQGAPQRWTMCPLKHRFSLFNEGTQTLLIRKGIVVSEVDKLLLQVVML